MTNKQPDQAVLITHAKSTSVIPKKAFDVQCLATYLDTFPTTIVFFT